MAGIGENVSSMGDWPGSDPSAQAFIPTFLSEDLGTCTFPCGNPQNGSAGMLPDGQKLKAVLGLVEEDGVVGMDMADDLLLEPEAPNVVSKPRSPGSLAERMAAKVGFSGLKINTARIRKTSMFSSPSEIRSPYLTIPPGLSPTTLLDSPVFLSNSLVQPSPTTGKFLSKQSCTVRSDPPAADSDKTKVHALADDGAQSIFFNPSVDSSSSYFPNLAKKISSSMDHSQLLPTIEVSSQPEVVKHENTDTADVQFQNPQEVDIKPCFLELSDQRNVAGDAIFSQHVSDSIMGEEQSPPVDDQQDGGETKGESSLAAVGAPSDDGYNWRKYGQKHVKGSEFPRSYYKCTHPNCPVKKKVERSYEGHITEIIYKGAHNHSKPPPNRRAAASFYHQPSDIINGSEAYASQTIPDGKSSWANALGGKMDPDWKNDRFEMTSTAIAAEFGDTASVQVQDTCHNGSDHAVDISSTYSNEDENDQETHGSVSLGCDDEDDESESKRRKLDTTVTELSSASRAVREPRVVVQTTSEVDILDDGYRWRKYGQKVVKGNPNPRSYYKCTNPGCTVRKHVERASHDLKSVITTYEGKHNHEVPAARNSSNSAPVPSSASSAHSIQRTPERSPASLPHFDGQLPLSAYALSLSSRDQLGPPAAAFSLAIGQEGFINLPVAGLGPSSQMKMVPPVHPYLRPPLMNSTGFMVPNSTVNSKGECRRDS